MRAERETCRMSYCRVATDGLTTRPGSRGATRAIWAAVCLAAAGCGGGGATSSGPSGAAQRFVGAVNAGDRGSWCRQIGSPPFAAKLRGPLGGAPLEQCIQQDLFLLLGSCDREAAIYGRIGAACDRERRRRGRAAHVGREHRSAARGKSVAGSGHRRQRDPRRARFERPVRRELKRGHKSAALGTLRPGVPRKA